MTARELIETLSSPFAVQESSENEIMNTASGSMNINQHDETELTLDSNSIKDFYELRYAILRSLNVHGELRILYDEIIHDNELNELIPQDLDSLIRYILDKNQDNNSLPRRNESIYKVLQWYNDKKSRNVSYARVQLVQRFDGQSYSVQTKILKSFLQNGSKRDREWASKKIYKSWDKSFIVPIKDAWEKYHEKSVGITMLKYLPTSYTMTQLHHLEASGIEQRYIYSTLGNENEFPYEISSTELDLPDYFYVMAKLNREIDENTATNLIVSYLAIMSKCDYEAGEVLDDYTNYIANPGITSYKDIGLIVWALWRLGLTSTLLQLLRVSKEMYPYKASGSREYSRRLNHKLEGVDKPLPLFGDLWEDPLYNDNNDESVCLDQFPASEDDRRCEYQDHGPSFPEDEDDLPPDF